MSRAHDESRCYRAVLAEFRSAEEMVSAASELRARGVRDVETYSPYRVPGTEEAIGWKGTRLPWFVLAGGALGGAASYAIQWWTNAVSYPLVVGGRPLDSIPAWVPITFEGTVLCAAATAFIGVFAARGLPRLWHPVFEVDGFERATIDRYWVSIDTRPGHANEDEAERLLASLRPLRVVPLVEEL